MLQLNTSTEHIYGYVTLVKLSFKPLMCTLH